MWIDADRDGVQDAGEASLPGVLVTLYRVVDGAPVRVSDTTTDAAGLYAFDNLLAGEYFVEFTLTEQQSQRYLLTRHDAGERGTGSDAQPVAGADRVTGRTPAFVLDGSNSELTTAYPSRTIQASEGIDPTWDAGVIERTYAVGDYVWIDADRDGVQDAGEDPLAGVTVRLLNADGDVVATTTTDANGYYLFDELPAGDYRLEFQLTAQQRQQYRFTQVGAGSDAGADSDAAATGTPGVGRTPLFRLDGDNAALTTDYDTADVRATEGIDPTWDAGVVTPTFAVGDYVWIDADGDGVQDADEKPLAGVTVELYRAGEDKPFRTTTTDAQGRYVFDGLPAGDYRIRFVLTDEQAELYEFTRVGRGDAGSGSDAAGDGWTVEFRLDASNDELVSGGEYSFADLTATDGIDPSWDAGVVLKTDAGVGDDDEDVPGTDEEEIPATGGQIAWGVGIAALTALLLGLVLLAWSRRRRIEA